MEAVANRFLGPMRQIEQAIAAHNAVEPEHMHMRLVWGYGNTEQAEGNLAEDECNQKQFGLLNYFKYDVEIVIALDDIGSEGATFEITFKARFPRGITFPVHGAMTFKDVYEVLLLCSVPVGRHGAAPLLSSLLPPETRVMDFPDDMPLGCSGLMATMPPESLAGDNLRNVIYDLGFCLDTIASYFMGRNE